MQLPLKAVDSKEVLSHGSTESCARSKKRRLCAQLAQKPPKDVGYFLLIKLDPRDALSVVAGLFINAKSADKDLYVDLLRYYVESSDDQVEDAVSLSSSQAHDVESSDDQKVGKRLRDIPVRRKKVKRLSKAAALLVLKGLLREPLRSPLIAYLFGILTPEHVSSETLRKGDKLGPLFAWNSAFFQEGCRHGKDWANSDRYAVLEALHRGIIPAVSFYRRIVCAADARPSRLNLGWRSGRAWDYLQWRNLYEVTQTAAQPTVPQFWQFWQQASPQRQREFWQFLQQLGAAPPAGSPPLTLPRNDVAQAAQQASRQDQPPPQQRQWQWQQWQWQTPTWSQQSRQRTSPQLQSQHPLPPSTPPRNDAAQEAAQPTAPLQPSHREPQLLLQLWQQASPQRQQQIWQLLHQQQLGVAPPVGVSSTPPRNDFAQAAQQASRQQQPPPQQRPQQLQPWQEESPPQNQWMQMSWHMQHLWQLVKLLQQHGFQQEMSWHMQSLWQLVNLLERHTWEQHRLLGQAWEQQTREQRRLQSEMLQQQRRELQMVQQQIMQQQQMGYQASPPS